jgi:5-formyltetrahydrofolate cyclo-ligase
MTDSAKAQARKDAALRRAAAHDPTGHAAQRACAHVMRALQDRFGADLSSQALAGYMALGDELDPLAAMQAHIGPVCVPVVQGRGQPLVFYRWTPDTPMVTGAFKVRVPAVADPITPDVLLVPMLAFDARGYRLGYGGGFYDRTLAGLRAQRRVLAIGFAYDAQEMAQVPTNATDEPLDMIVTPAGIRVYSAPTTRR